MYCSAIATSFPLVFALLTCIVLAGDASPVAERQNSSEPCERKPINASESVKKDNSDKGTDVLESRLRSRRSSEENPVVDKLVKPEKTRKARAAENATVILEDRGYPPPLSPYGIADAVTLREVTNSSVTIFWDHLAGGDQRDYRLVGYTVNPGGLTVKEKVTDIYIVSNIHWRQQWTDDDLSSGTLYLYCLIPVLVENGVEVFNEVYDVQSVSDTGDCVTFYTLGLLTVIPTVLVPEVTYKLLQPVAGIVSVAILFLICICLILTIIRYCGPPEEEEQRETKKEKPSLLHRLLHPKRKRKKRDPSEWKYLGEDRPDFGDITQEVGGVLKD